MYFASRLKFSVQMSRALVASSATTSGLSLLFHLTRYLSSSPSPVPVSPLPLPELEICPAGTSAETEGLHWPSVVVGIFIGFLLIPLAEALITARLLAFRSVLRRLGFQEREPLYRLL